MRARTDLWEPGASNCPGPPDRYKLLGPVGKPVLPLFERQVLIFFPTIVHFVTNQPR